MDNWRDEPSVKALVEHIEKHYAGSELLEKVKAAKGILPLKMTVVNWYLAKEAEEETAEVLDTMRLVWAINPQLDEQGDE